MKVVFLARSLDPGGAERQLVVLAKGLQARGYDVTIVLFYGGGLFEEFLSDSSVRLIILGKKGRWDFGFFLRLLRVLRTVRPDVIHGYLSTANIFATVAGRFVPYAKVVWGVRSANVDTSHYDRLHRLVCWVEGKLAKLSDLIIVNSCAGYRHAVNAGFPVGCMVVIPNGIDTSLFRPNLRVREEWRAKWRLTEDIKAIGLVSRLDPLKDHKTFLSAAAVLAKRRNDTIFICVGEGPDAYKAELKTYAEILGIRNRLIWEHNSTGIKDLYSALDVACSSSIAEGFPNVVAEAMACGVPCVVTDVGDSARIVGSTGIVVSPRDPMALADGIDTLLQQIETTGELSRAAARARIVAEFNVDKMIERTIAVLQAL